MSAVPPSLHCNKSTNVPSQTPINLPARSSTLPAVSHVGSQPAAAMRRGLSRLRSVVAQVAYQSGGVPTNRSAAPPPLLPPAACSPACPPVSLLPLPLHTLCFLFGFPCLQQQATSKGCRAKHMGISAEHRPLAVWHDPSRGENGQGSGQAGAAQQAAARGAAEVACGKQREWKRHSVCTATTAAPGQPSQDGAGSSSTREWQRQ